jgi:hypothetical protein
MGLVVYEDESGTELWQSRHPAHAAPGGVVAAPDGTRYVVRGSAAARSLPGARIFLKRLEPK